MASPARVPLRCERRPSRRAWRIPARFAAALLMTAAAPSITAAEPMRLGAVQFAATGATAAQPHFQRGVAALHSFWYEVALAAFQRTLEIDPDFTMAWWGIAMTYHRPYMPGSDDAAGRAALDHIRNTRRLTPREAAYIAALRAFYADKPWAERTLAYAGAMGKLYRDYPDDREAAAFFSLSLLGYGWSNDEGFARQEQAAAVAADVYRHNPQHPGAAHYLIHSYDEPSLAARGLEAARHYATIAPDAPHALHMPSHIFLQLGLWSEVARSNEAAWAASESWVRTNRLNPNQRDYHNYHWLIYACLQQGRYARAAELAHEFRRMRGDIGAESRHFLSDALASYVVETRRWHEAEPLFAADPREATAPPPVSPRPIELCGVRTEEPTGATADMPAYLRAFAAAATGAPDAGERLLTLRQAATANNAIARFWRIRILEVAATARARAAEFPAALAAIREATAIEETFGPPPGPPSSIKPPHELAGEILLEAGRPGEGLAQFHKALERHPNRARALLGLARAEAALDMRAAAATTYGRFLELWREADENLPERREALRFVAEQVSSHPPADRNPAKRAPGTKARD